MPKRLFSELCSEIEDIVTTLRGVVQENASMEHALGQIVDRLESVPALMEKIPEVGKGHDSKYIMMRQLNRLVQSTREIEALSVGFCDILVNVLGFGAAWVYLRSREEGGRLFGTQREGDITCNPPINFAPALLPDCCHRYESEKDADHPYRKSANCDQCVLHTICGDSQVLTARIQYGSQHLGWLTVCREGNQRFTDEDRCMLLEVGTDLAFAMINLVRERDQEAERRQLLALLDGIEDVIYVADPKTHELLYVNETAKRLWGEDILGKPCYHVLQNLERPCPFCTNPQIFGEYRGQVYTWEFKNEINDRWYRCADKAVQWVDGREVRFELASDITESKEIARALEDSERRYRLLIETMPRGWAAHRLLHDQDNRLVDTELLEANQTFLRIAGLDRDMMQGKVGSSVFPWLFGPQAEQIQALPVTNQSMEGLGYEVYLEPRDCWLRVSAFSHTPGECITMLENITREKKEEQLQAMKLGLHQFSIDHSTDELLVEVLDRAGELLKSPLGFYHFVGANQRDIILQAWSTKTKEGFCTTQPEAMHYSIEQAGVWADCIRERRPVIHNEYATLPRKKGLPEGHAPVIRELTVPVLRNGKIVAVLGLGNKPSEYDQTDVDILSHIANSTWDLIERNQLHDQLLQIGQAIDSVNEAIGISKPTGEHVYQNEAFTRMFGYELDAFASMSPKVLYADPAQAEEVFTGISQGESWKGEIEMVAKDGKRIPVALRADAVRGERGNIIALVGIHMDITESKAMQAELQKAYEEVMRSNKDLEHFAYVASHDLQEPLRMISSYTQLLETRYREMLDEKAQKYIYYAVDGAQRMQRMIQDLLRFSRINTHGRAPEQCDAHHALGQALANLHVLIAEKGALVTNDDHPTVAADESQLVQLFQNLIENAIKFQQTESPRVHIKATWDQGVCDFSVRDNGIGMDEQQQEKVFLIFHRLNNRSQYPGTGIGLAMCKRIVERHGGRIWYRSAPGQGTTMHFTLNCFP